MGLWKDQKDLLKAVTSPEFAELHQRSKQMQRPGMLDGIRQANALLDQMGEQQRLLMSGIPGRARIDAMADTGTTVNEQPIAELTMTVEVPGMSPYQVTTRQTGPAAVDRLVRARADRAREGRRGEPVVADRGHGRVRTAARARPPAPPRSSRRRTRPRASSAWPASATAACSPRRSSRPRRRGSSPSSDPRSTPHPRRTPDGLVEEHEGRDVRRGTGAMTMPSMGDVSASTRRARSTGGCPRSAGPATR